MPESAQREFQEEAPYVMKARGGNFSSGEFNGSVGSKGSKTNLNFGNVPSKRVLGGGFGQSSKNLTKMLKEQKKTIIQNQSRRSNFSSSKEKIPHANSRTPLSNASSSPRMQ